jgi:hypothetical protein|tara:strand:- start:16 stop:207 length:192 start_codon:yes stop_codon:yes gene_type:complete
MNFKAKAMLAASAYAYAYKEKLTEATAFIKEHWLDIATAALAIYIVEDIIDPDVIVTTEQGVL